MKTIVLTGGPCAGKTSVIRALQERFATQITFVPEVATMLFGNGFPIPGRDLVYNPECSRAFQKAYGTAQLSLEYLYGQIATQKGHKLMVCDRGLWDGAAYSQMSWEDYAQLIGVDFSKVETRYEIVIHLRSLAVTNPSMYETATNSARYETVKKAVQADEKILKCYKRHPNYLRINADVDSLVAKINVVGDIITANLQTVDMSQ